MAEDRSSTPDDVAREARTGPLVSSPAEQAAIAFARDHRDAYGRRWRTRELQWTVVNADPLDSGNVSVTLTYRPVANFRGRPGEEVLVVAPNGEVVTRTRIHRLQEEFPWILAVMAVAAVVAAPILIWLILTQESRGIDPLYVSGRILWMRVTEPRVVDVIHYTGSDTSGEIVSWAITPENEDTELAIITVTLINQQTSRAVVVIDEEAAHLVIAERQTVKPLNTVGRSKSIEAIDPSYLDPRFLPLWNTVSIGSGEQVAGQMVFEVPRGSKFKEFRWQATDNMSARFR